MINRVEKMAADYLVSDCPMAATQIADGLELKHGETNPMTPVAQSLRNMTVGARLRADSEGEHHMKPLARADLMSLEQYARAAQRISRPVIEHKKYRRVDVGPTLSLYFEDRLTIQYQVQEMLRIEKIFEAAAIQEELEAYNPLIPDGDNLKATAMLEFEDVEIRRQRLAELVEMEHTVWAQVAGYEKVFAISNEDMERSTEEKTSAVHFMRFEFSPGMIAALRGGADLSFGSDHPAYPHQLTVPTATRRALMEDFD